MASADLEIGAGVRVAGVQNDDAWTLHDGFTVSQQEVDPILSWREPHREPACVACRGTLALPGRDVDDFDRPTVQRDGTFGPSNRPSQQAVGWRGLG